jgi:hypothetical protein
MADRLHMQPLAGIPLWPWSMLKFVLLPQRHSSIPKHTEDVVQIPVVQSPLRFVRMRSFLFAPEQGRSGKSGMVWD